ncbi:MAG TPA: cupin domain-containing protein [bacterium]|nr:cupin domain-containing protein [bacterium]
MFHSPLSKTLTCFVVTIAIVLSFFFDDYVYSDNSPFKQYVFSTTHTKRYKFPTHINDLIIDRSEAQTSEVFIVVLNPGQAPPLHKHDNTEQVFYILEGMGTLFIGKEEEKYPVKTGDVVRIPPTVFHKIEAEGSKQMRYLAIDCFLSGRPVDEPTWDDHIKVVCHEQGWDYNKIISEQERE